ncbi:MAG: hypothetical protein WCO98_03025 [bacterium]
MRLILLLLVLLSIGISAYSLPQVTVFNKNERPTYSQENLSGVIIDWEKGKLYVTVEGKCPISQIGTAAKNIARADAIRQAYDAMHHAVGELPLTSYATYSVEVFTENSSNDLLEQLMQKSMDPVVEKWTFETRTMAVTFVIQMYGKTSLNDVAGRSLANMQRLRDKDISLTTQSTIKKVAVKKEIENKPGPYTGVIFDCTGIDYSPTFLPRLIADNGQCLWGVDNINPIDVSDNALVRYFDNAKNAIASGRVGANPLVIRPIAIGGVNQCDMVLSDTDNDALIFADSKAKFLSKFAVAIVLGNGKSLIRKDK